MPVESAAIRTLFSAVSKLKGKIFYPGIPFVLVPMLVGGLAISQFSGSLDYSLADRPAALDLPVSLSTSPEGERSGATLLLVPEGADAFYLGGDAIDNVWLSVPQDKLPANEHRIRVDPQGLDLDRLRGVSYPIAVVVEGSIGDSIDLELKKPKLLSKLELAATEATWIVLFLFGGAIFGFGASTGFMKDPPVVE